MRSLTESFIDQTKSNFSLYHSLTALSSFLWVTQESTHTQKFGLHHPSALVATLGRLRQPISTPARTPCKTLPPDPAHKAIVWTLWLPGAWQFSGSASRTWPSPVCRFTLSTMTWALIGCFSVTRRPAPISLVGVGSSAWICQSELQQGKKISYVCSNTLRNRPPQSRNENVHSITPNTNIQRNRAKVDWAMHKIPVPEANQTVAPSLRSPQTMTRGLRLTPNQQRPCSCAQLRAYLNGLRAVIAAGRSL